MKKTIIFLFVLANIINAQITGHGYKFERFSKTNDNTPLSNSILDIIVINDTVWLGTTKGLSQSVDGGATFKNYYNSADFGTESISAIGYNKGVIWAATAHNTDRDGQSLATGSGLRYSSNNGATWTIIDQPKDLPGDSSVVYGVNTIRALPVTVDISNITYDIAFSKNTIWIASFAGGLRKSTNMGATWERVILPPDYLSSIKPTDILTFTLQPIAGAFGKESYLNHRLFSVASSNDSTVYVGTAGGINKTTDNGISWEKFNHTNQDSPICGNFIVAIGIIQGTNDVWSASWKAEGSTEFYGVSYSHDGGNTWQNYLEGEKAHNFAFIYDPDDFAITENYVFAATDNGIFRSANSGQTWFAPPSIYDRNLNFGITPYETSFYSINTNKLNNKDVIWVGSSSGLARLIETNGMWTGDWKIYLSSQPLTGNDEAYAFPNPFSPDAELVKIKFNMGSSSDDVTIRIMDFGMNLVRTVVQNETYNTIGDNYAVWDGRDENGKIVPNGVYFYRIDRGDKDPVFGKIIVLM
ncbi:MAG: FlgD immunoglobulin-like domain containing protein [bacterium]